MSALKKLEISALLYGVAIFIFSPSFQKLIGNTGFWNVKEQLLYLTGSVAMTYMTACIVLSLRIGRVNGFMGGLDKAYAAHKRLGIWAVALSFLHWAIEHLPKLLKDTGLIPPKIRSGGVSPYTDFEKALYDAGNQIGEIGFYILLLVIIVSLLKKIPYNMFRRIHKVIPALFLAVAFHGATIQIKGQWFGSFGSALLWVLLIAGSAAAVMALFQFVGKNRKVKGKVGAITHDAGSRITDLRIVLPENSFTYKAGQYAFLKFASCPEPHPFSIASYNKEMKEIRFLIKELGDFTKNLPSSVKAGEDVVVEGAYGGFIFDDGSPRQIWIAGGIGVTPFMSRLEYLAVEGGTDNTPVDFFYCARGESPLKPVLEELCAKAGVKFHYNDSAKSGRLDIDGIKEKTGPLDRISVWYCGPAAFGRYLKKALKENGGDIKLHYDNFDMR